MKVNLYIQICEVNMMIRLAKLALPLLLLASPNLWAASSSKGLETFFQPGAGQVTIFPLFSYAKVAYTGTALGSNVDSNINIAMFGSTFEYGFNDSISIGTRISYTNTKNDTSITGTLNSNTSTTSSGLNDISLLLKGTSQFNQFRLRYGATLELSPGDNETDSSGDSNAYSGGHTLDPYIGFDFGDRWIVGAKVSREILLTDKTSIDSSGTKSTSSGGETTEISLSTEAALTQAFKIGLGASVSFYDPTIDENGKKEDGLSPIYQTFLYSAIEAGPGILLPTISFAITPDETSDIVKVDSVSTYGLQLGYRMTF